jgi:hypothetical protein
MEDYEDDMELYEREELRKEELHDQSISEEARAAGEVSEAEYLEYEAQCARNEELSDQQGARYDLYVEDCHNAGEAAMDFEEWEDML